MDALRGITYIILWLPTHPLLTCQHISLTRSSTVSTGHHLLWLFGLVVHVVFPEAEVTVRVGLGVLLPQQVGGRGKNNGNTGFAG